MSKPEWGVKRVCNACGAKFYDMKRTPVVCPKCDSELDLEALNRPRRPERKKAAPKVVEPDTMADDADVDVDDDLEVDAGDDMDDFMEDASDLGEDDSDLDEVKDHIAYEENE
ncbi:TIGR02300 family protein [Phaeovibrio sulfidiphilus]|uniref:TIGR02300 family protein n=1 Tax=Phaeovibrio sulfidiphilus TaxID=1220600 RepID=A0A8J7CP62_9PROT|nr:TIGR02300 family protein [Phaeovibrio sulfidiphilus]MBE1236677.1 TIGR02300 family protein [Phaeovibrio sulfidiphilus]